MSTPYRLRASSPTTLATAVRVLGPQVRSFCGTTNRNVVWAAAPFALLLGYGVWLAHQGLLERWFNSTFSVGVVAVLFVASIALIVRTAAGGGSDLVRVHANGILDLRGGLRAVRWDEIESLVAVPSQDEKEIDHHRLLTSDGSIVSLGQGIGNVEELVDEIRMHLGEHALPRVRARIAQGDVIRFGALAADASGVAIGEQTIPWDEVGAIEAEAGRIVVRDRDGARRLAARLDEVPNAFLLAEIAHGRRA
jgi:hypothetical protein